ncbi:MAG: flagellar motor switch protein FliN [Firmicutes bacterium]|nr:flagellar motor switch protein FliN [Bacillota bacterium]
MTEQPASEDIRELVESLDDAEWPPQGAPPEAEGETQAARDEVAAAAAAAAARPWAPAGAGRAAAGTPVGLEIVMDVPLEVTVELGRTHQRVRDVLELGPGAVIELDRMAGEPVDVLVNGRLVAKGEVVVVDEAFGVRITEILSPEQRLERLS